VFRFLCRTCKTDLRSVYSAQIDVLPTGAHLFPSWDLDWGHFECDCDMINQQADWLIINLNTMKEIYTDEPFTCDDCPDRLKCLAQSRKCYE